MRSKTHSAHPCTKYRPDLWLKDHASADPEKAALIFRGRAISYREFWDRIACLASGLVRAGLRLGDRIAFLGTNHPSFLETYFASSLLGSIFVPLNFRMAIPEIASQLESAGPSILILGPKHGSLANEVSDLALDPPPRIFHVEEPGIAGMAAPFEGLFDAGPIPIGEALGRPFSVEDPQMIMFTSGTTGTPKGPLLPYRKTLFNSLNAEAFFELVGEDRVLVPVPLFHSLGLNILSLPVLFKGGTVILMETFDSRETLEAIQALRPTFMGAVPTIYRRLMESNLEGWDLSSLRFCFTAGAPITVSLIEAYHSMGILLKQGFGQTETSILCCLDACDAIRKAGSVGKPVQHAEVRIVDDRMQEVEPGVVGEIVARGEILMLGYWNLPEETARAFHGTWLKTQDLAFRDEEGFITLVGRKGDMYISGGENVWPEQVEEALLSCPQIEEVAVIGVPDPDLGEVGCAFFVAKAEAQVNTESILEHVRGRIAGYKLPRRFVQVESLPRTVTGKVKKYVLRKSVSVL